MTMDAETESWVLPGTSRLIVALAVPALIAAALAALELTQVRSPSERPPRQCHPNVELVRIEGNRLQAVDRAEESRSCVTSTPNP